MMRFLRTLFGPTPACSLILESIELYPDDWKIKLHSTRRFVYWVDYGDFTILAGLFYAKVYHGGLLFRDRMHIGWLDERRVLKALTKLRAKQEKSHKKVFRHTELLR